MAQATTASAARSSASADPEPPFIYWHCQDSRVLSVDDCLVHLSADEAAIMGCFLKVPGAVVSESALLYALYVDRDREEPDTAYQALANKFHRLRAKGIPIANVWGKGWHLIVAPDPVDVGATYIGRDDVGRWKVVGVVREPMVRIVSMDSGEELQVPVSSLEMWGFKRERAGQAGPPVTATAGTTDGDLAGLEMSEHPIGRIC